MLRRLLRNIIWQAYERITTGDEPGVGGNLRTFWYRFVKPTLAHIDDDDALKSDPYDRMLHISHSVCYPSPGRHLSDLLG